MTKIIICPKCQGDIKVEPVNLYRGATLLSSTVRCETCDCSIGLDADDSHPHVVYDPGEYRRNH